jgi:division protein CdvB (Snf7/Vps24/ESCRT-III family)
MRRIMSRKARYLLLLIMASAAIAVGAWALLRFKVLRRQALRQADSPSNLRTADPDLWTRSMEKVKEDRGGGSIEIPPELRHYEDRHWFLATQVAEARKFNLQSCQDFVDLAAMIQRGELVSLPAVTDTYILFGVGAKADAGMFSRYIDDHNIDLYDEAELRDAYARLDAARAKLQTEISSLQTQLSARKKGTRTKQSELQKEIAARVEELKTNDEEKSILDRTYGQPESRQKLLRDYESLQTLAKNFGGRFFNLNDSSDREAMKVTMLSSLRPQALTILEEIAKDYHDKFDHPLPVSSLIRPEQYQHTLRKSNRNAVLIDTPPHSTGLAFDIDYRYMSGAEQTFLMMELARMKDGGRIEVIRERNSNYHVFAFVDGQRPSDDLITASLDEASGPVQETNHATKTPVKTESKSRTAKQTKTNPKATNTTSKSRAKKRR